MDPIVLYTHAKNQEDPQSCFGEKAKKVLKKTRQVYNGPWVVKFISADRKQFLVKNDF